MGRLIYLMNVSLDGYIETTDHSLDWTTIDDEMHGWFNDELRRTEALFYGRRLFEGMNAHWPTADQAHAISSWRRSGLRTTATNAAPESRSRLRRSRTRAASHRALKN